MAQVKIEDHLPDVSLTTDGIPPLVKQKWNKEVCGMITVEDACEKVISYGFKYLGKITITPSVILVTPLNSRGENGEGDWFAFDRETGEEVMYDIGNMLDDEPISEIIDPPKKYRYKKKRIWHR